MSIVLAITVLLFYLSLHRTNKRNLSIQRKSSDTNLWIVVILGSMATICGLLSLLTSRPDGDDVDHLVRAVHNFENFSQPLLLRSPFAFVLDEKANLFSTTRSYEHLCASLAQILSLKPIHIYHYLMPVLAGASVPVVWYLLLSRLTGSPEAAVFGAMWVVLVLCTDSPNHQSFGNWGFVRVWVGKCIFMTIVTPLSIKYLLDAFNTSSFSAHMRITAVSVIGLGLSPMTLFYFPILFFAVATSYSAVEFRKIHLRNVFLTGAFLSAYLVILGSSHYWVTQKMIAGWPVESQWPNDLIGIARIVFGSPPGISGTIAIIALALLAVLKKWRVLVWLLVWTSIIIVPLSFPTISTWMSTHVTSRNAFWRTLYILPTFLCIGVASAELYKRLSSKRWVIGCVAIASTLIVIFLNSSLGGIGPWAKTNVSFPVLGLKLPPAGLACSLEIIDTLKPGPMIAPEEISEILPIFTARFPQCYLRSYERLTGFPDKETLLRRLATHSFVSERTTSEEAFADFCLEIASPYRYVILSLGLSAQARNVKALANAGFVHGNLVGDKYQVFERR